LPSLGSKPHPAAAGSRAHTDTRRRALLAWIGRGPGARPLAVQALLALVASCWEERASEPRVTSHGPLLQASARPDLRSAPWPINGGWMLPARPEQEHHRLRLWRRGSPSPCPGVVRAAWIPSTRCMCMGMRVGPAGIQGRRGTSPHAARNGGGLPCGCSGELCPVGAPRAATRPGPRQR